MRTLYRIDVEVVVSCRAILMERALWVLHGGPQEHRKRLQVATPAHESAGPGMEVRGSSRGSSPFQIIT